MVLGLILLGNSKMKVTFDTQSFGTKNVKTVNRSPVERIEITNIELGDFRVLKRKQFFKDTLNYSLISIYRAGKWLKSKLIYFKDGKVTKVMRSNANDYMV